MKESSFLLFLIFLSNINDHFPESNDYNKNTCVTSNIFLILDKNDISSYLELKMLYNDYGIKYKESMRIRDMKNIYSFTNISQIKLIDSDSLILINNIEIFEKVVNQLIEEDFYSPNDCVVLLVEDNILNNLSSEEVKKYKKVKNCFIFIYDDILVYNQLIEIQNNKSKIRQILLDIDLTYASYPTINYIIFLCLLFIGINFILYLFIKGYLKINNEHHLGIHIIIFICYILLNISYIFVFVEILLSKTSLLYKLIPKEYFIIKILKVIFLCLTKNSIMLVFLLISRAYCILFFDQKYKNKYIIRILIILLCDYALQLLFKFFDSYLLGFIYVKDLYNTLYYILLCIYIYYKGRNISLGLRVILYVVEHDNMRVRTQEELNNVREVINLKSMLRRQSILLCYIFCVIGVISPLIFLIFSSSLKGNTVYDLLTLLHFSLIVSGFTKIFYPRELLPNYTITYEQLINGIPEEFLNEYLYRFNKENYITKEAFSRIVPKESPILIVTPLQILKDDINNIYKKKDLNNKENNDSFNNDMAIKIINSFSEKGQIGFWDNSE